MDGRIYHLIELFTERLNHEWTVNEMSKIVDLTPTHLPRVFRANVGASPIAYLNRLRLEKARELLETTFLQIKQIGMQTGLKNESHFTRKFKEMFGLCPREYRKRHWEQMQNRRPVQ